MAAAGPFGRETTHQRITWKRGGKKNGIRQPVETVPSDADLKSPGKWVHRLTGREKLKNKGRGVKGVFCTSAAFEAPVNNSGGGDKSGNWGGRDPERVPAIGEQTG